jgi:hypothetical protein
VKCSGEGVLPDLLERVEPASVEDASRSAIAGHLDGDSRRVWFVASHLTDAQETRYRTVLDERYTHVEPRSFLGVRVHEYVTSGASVADSPDGGGTAAEPSADERLRRP